MDPDDLLLSELARSRGLFGNVPDPQPVFDFNAGGSAFGSIPGLVPLGQIGLNMAFGRAQQMPSRFFPGANLFRQYEAKAFIEARQRALQDAAQADRMTHVDLMQGLARMTGTPFGLEQRRAAGVVADDIAMIAPFLAQAMPEIYDAAHGARGSAVVMAQGIHRGGRFALDPVTGRVKLSGDSAAAVSREISRMYFGPDADLGAFRGLSQGQVGALYDELQSRGAMGRGLGSLAFDDRVDLMTSDREGRRAAIDALLRDDPAGFERVRQRVAQARPGAGLAAMSPRDAGNALAGMDQDAGPALAEVLKSGSRSRVDELARGFDARAIGGRLKNLAGAVSAMREIFGDMGRPDAPMAEILAGLDALTQGGLATTPPAELERLVRTTSSLAKTSGMGMQALAAVTAQAAALADSRGLDRRAAVEASQGSAAFGAALGQSGMLSFPTPGGASRDQLTLLDSRLRVQASGSEVFNRLSAAYRFAELEEAQGRGGNLTNTRIGRLVAAIRNGERSVVLQPGEAPRSLLSIEAEDIVAMSKEAKAADGVMANMIMARAANQDAGHRVGLQGLTRSLQAENLAPFAAEQFRAPTIAALTDRLGPAAARQIADAAGTRQGLSLFQLYSGADAQFNLDPATRADPAKRAAMLGELLAQEVEKVNPAVARQLRDSGQAAQIAGAGFDLFLERAKTSPRFAAYGGGMPMLQAQDPGAFRLARSLEQDTQAKVAIETALSPLAKSPPLARMMDAIRDAGTMPAGTLIARALGGQNPDDVAARIASIPVDALAQAGTLPEKDRLVLAMDELVSLAQRYSGTPSTPASTPEEAQRRLTQLRESTATANALRQGGDVARARVRELEPRAATDPTVARTIVALKATYAGGIDRMTAAMDTGQPAVTSSVLGDWQGQDRLLRAVGANTPDARRYASGVVDRGGRLIDALLGDVPSLASLGAGGFDLAVAARRDYQAMAYEASELGVSPASLLSGEFQPGNPQQVAARERALAARDAFGHKLDELRQRMETGMGARQPIDAGERARIQEYMDRESRPASALNREAIDTFVGGMLPDLGPAERNQLASKLGDGAESGQRRARLGALARQRTSLEAMARFHGMDLEAYHRAVADEQDPNAKSILWFEREQARAQFESLGAFGDRLTPENLSKMLERTATPVTTDGPTAMEISGTLQLSQDGRTARISGLGSAASRPGSIPVR